MSGGDAELKGLFEAVYRAPHHDAPRQVLADALLERGDPRGEFIALSLQPRPGMRGTRRMAKLLDRHRSAFLGPLATAVASQETWSKGFLSRAGVRLDGSLVGEHAWATLTHVTVLSEERTPELASEWFRSLAEVRGLPAAGIHDVFAAPRALAMTTVALSGPADLSGWSEAVIDEVGTAASLPRLERLGLRSTTPHLDELPWLWRLPVADRLKVLEVKGGFAMVPVQAVLDAARGAPRPPEALEIRGSAVIIRTRRSSGFRDLDFHVTEYGAAGTLGAVARMLDLLHAPSLAALTITTERAVPREVMRVLRTAVRRFSRGTVVKLPQAA